MDALPDSAAYPVCIALAPACTRGERECWHAHVSIHVLTHSLTPDTAGVSEEERRVMTVTKACADDLWDRAQTGRQRRLQ